MNPPKPASREVNAMSTAQVYAANRKNFSLEDLVKYQGRWVAFSRDGFTILADGESELELASKADQLGLKRTEYVMESIPQLDASLLL